MEQNERIIFQDIPARGKYQSFHSAILTTYAIDLIHFETHIRNQLHRKEICSINVFADKNQIERTLQYVSPLSLTHIGNDYTITSVASLGAFHPKINFFVGYNSVLALIGSGNLTVTGHGKNHEVFTGFMIDEDDNTQRPLIEELWYYLKHIVSKSGEYEKRRIMREIPDNCEFLDEKYKFEPHSLCTINENLSAALLYNDADSGILSQLSKLIPTYDVNTITIVSPFFDEDGKALLNIMDLCPNAKMDVLIQNTCTLPPNKMPTSYPVNFYSFDDTKRGDVKIGNYKRHVHAKIIHFSTDDTEYCIIGSANATVAGLGTMTKRGSNDELCVLYVSTKIKFLTELWINPHRHHVIDATIINRPRQTETKTEKYSFTITNACYDHGFLKIYLDEPRFNLDKTYITLNDGIKPLRFEHYCVDGNILTIETVLKKSSFTCYLEHYKDAEIFCKCSNTVFVNRIDELESTNPSRASRELKNFISYIESDGYNSLEVVDMLSNVMYGLVNNSSAELYTSKSTPSSVKIKDRNNLSDSRHNIDEIDEDNNDKQTYRMSNKLGISKLITGIEDSINRKLHSIEEELNDEEEIGSAETSNNRSIDTDYSIHVKKDDIQKYCSQVSSVLNKYKNLVVRRVELCRVTNGSMSEDDICFFALSMFASVEIAYLNRFFYDFESIDSMDKSFYQKKLFEKLDMIMGTDGLNALTAFAHFCKRYAAKRETADSEYSKNGKRAIKYALLYASFLYRDKNWDYKKKDIKKAIDIIIKLFPLPTKKDLASDLQPLIERYNHIVEIRDIERVLTELDIKLPQ